MNKNYSVITFALFLLVSLGALFGTNTSAGSKPYASNTGVAVPVWIPFPEPTPDSLNPEHPFPAIYYWPVNGETTFTLKASVRGGSAVQFIVNNEVYAMYRTESLVGDHPVTLTVHYDPPPNTPVRFDIVCYATYGDRFPELIHPSIFAAP